MTANRTTIIKSRELAMSARRDGNDAYGKGDYTAAALAYTQSLRHSPLASVEYALALANRSAAAAHAQQWRECAIDCRRSLAHAQLPEKSRDKVATRLIDAEVEMSTQPANDLWSVDASAAAEMRARNEVAAALTADAKIIYRQSHGRMVVAACKLPAGTLALSEVATITAVNWHMRDHLCAHCARHLPVCSVPCRTCDTLYCDETCEHDAHATYHRFECAHRDRLCRGETDEQLKEIITIRTICSAPLSELMQFTPRLDGRIDIDSWSVQNVGKWGTTGAKAKIGRNLRSIMSLYGHGAENRPLSETMRQSCLAMIEFLVCSSPAFIAIMTCSRHGRRA